MNIKIKNKLVLFSPLPPPEGGIASWTLDYLEYCKKNKIPVFHINTSMVGKNLKHHEKRNFFDELKRIKNIKKQIKNFSCYDENTIVHYNTSCSLFGMMRDYFCFFKFFKNSKIVMQCHCDVSLYLKGKMHKWIFRKIANKCRKLLVLNEQSLNFIKKIANNVDVSYFPNFIKNDSMPRLKRIKSEKCLNVAFVGHIRKEKGFDILLECAKVYKNINFHIFGQKPKDFIEPNLDNVHFYGVLKQNELYTHLSMFDALLAPSFAEGFSMSLLECLSIGLYIITSPAGAAKTVLSNTKNIVTENYNVECFIEAFRQLISISNEEFESISASNVKLAETFDINNVLKKLFDIYNNISLA